VFRGSAYDGRPFWVRGGFRDGYYGRGLIGGNIGFRLAEWCNTGWWVYEWTR